MDLYLSYNKFINNIKVPEDANEELKSRSVSKYLILISYGITLSLAMGITTISYYSTNFISSILNDE